MNGILYKRTTLSAGTAVVVDFGKAMRNLSIARMTSEPVYYKIGDHSALATTDMSANVLTDETPVYDFHDYPTEIRKITFVAAAYAGVQWEAGE